MSSFQQALERTQPAATIQSIPDRFVCSLVRSGVEPSTPPGTYNQTAQNCSDAGWVTSAPRTSRVWFATRALDFPLSCFAWTPSPPAPRTPAFAGDFHKIQRSRNSVPTSSASFSQHYLLALPGSSTACRFPQPSSSPSLTQARVWLRQESEGRQPAA